MYLPGRVAVITRRDRTRWAAEVMPTAEPEPMMVALTHIGNGAQPFGHSRITRYVRQLCDEASRTLFRMQVMSTFYMMPRLALMGLSDEQFDAVTSSKMRTYVDSLIATTHGQDGGSPTLQQLNGASPQPFVEQLGMLARQFSFETSVPLASLGVVTSNPTSAEAIEAECGDICDAATMIARSAVWRYGDGAASLAADLYDRIAKAEGLALANAEMYDGPDLEAISRGVHYQAGRLVNGDADGFADGCEELVCHHVGQAYRKTVYGNVRRDHGRGIRYARVPMGVETCTYCTMLASRGFDYRSEESAGHASHRGCDCLIVPGVQGRTLVGGYDPRALYARWQEFEEIDSATPLGEDGRPLSGADLKRWRRERKLSAVANFA